MNFLVVDPNIAFATLLEQELRRLGHRVAMCSSGEEALALARHQMPELALLDMALEGPDAMTLGRELRALDDGVRLMLIPMQGEDLAFPEDAPSVQGILPKPFFLPELPSAIQAAIDAPLNGNGRHADPEPPPAAAADIPLAANLPDWAKGGPDGAVPLDVQEADAELEALLAASDAGMEDGGSLSWLEDLGDLPGASPDPAPPVAAPSPSEDTRGGEDLAMPPLEPEPPAPPVPAAPTRSGASDPADRIADEPIMRAPAERWAGRRFSDVGTTGQSSARAVRPVPNWRFDRAAASARRDPVVPVPAVAAAVVADPEEAEEEPPTGISRRAFRMNQGRIESLMGRLANDVGADGVLLTCRQGLLTAVGGLDEAEIESISTAVLHGAHTSAEVARILGREQVRFEQSIAGGSYMLYALGVHDAILAVTVSGDAALGLLRLSARGAAERIADLCIAD